MKKPKESSPKMDEIDLEAEQEGLAIKKMNKYRVKNTNRKSKVRPVG